MNWAEVAWAGVAPAWAVVGAATGYLMGRRNRSSEPETLNQKVQPICGCKHHRSFHAEGNGKCAAYDEHNHMWCRCQGYNGPKTYTEVMDEELEG